MAANEFTRENAMNGVPSQAILDAGLNVFALQLLLESFTDLAGENTSPLSFTYLGVNVTLQVATVNEQTAEPQSPKDTNLSKELKKVWRCMW